VSGYVLTTYNDADDDDELLIETHWLWLMSSQWVVHCQRWHVYLYEVTCTWRYSWRHSTVYVL